MGFEALPVAGERDVDEVLVVPKVLEGAGDAALVVVPAETEVLCVHHFEFFLMWLSESCVRYGVAVCGRRGVLVMFGLGKIIAV